jgi:hypothetical protein
MGDIGGINTGWDNTSPAAGDDSGLGDDHFRSIKTSLQEILDSEHDFTTTGGSKTGMHRHGSALPYVGVQSNVSSGDTTGRLYFTSDTSRLFALGDTTSTATVFLGSKNVIEQATDTDGFDRIWAEESGALFGGSGHVNFGVGYDGLPIVTCSEQSASVAAGAIPAVWVSDLTNQGCKFIRRTYVGGGVTTTSGSTTMWRSLGTRSVAS